MAQLESILGGFLAFLGLLVGVVGVAVSFMGVTIEEGASRLATTR